MLCGVVGLHGLSGQAAACFGSCCWYAWPPLCSPPAVHGGLRSRSQNAASCMCQHTPPTCSVTPLPHLTVHGVLRCLSLLCEELEEAQLPQVRLHGPPTCSIVPKCGEDV